MPPNSQSPAPKPTPKERDPPAWSQRLFQCPAITLGAVKQTAGEPPANRTPLGKSTGAATQRPGSQDRAPARRDTKARRRRSEAGGRRPPSFCSFWHAALQNATRGVEMAGSHFWLTLGFPPPSGVNSSALGVAEAIPVFQPTSEESGSCLNWILD